MMNMREIEMKIRRKVLGDNYVDCAAAATTDFDRPLQDLVVDAAWGQIWATRTLYYHLRHFGSTWPELRGCDAFAS